MPEVVVLATHTWIWFINGDFDQFPEHWKPQIELADHVGISPVSCFEIALACQRGKLVLSCSPEAWFQDALAPAGIEVFELIPEIAVRAVGLSSIHRDPFDRIIMATALEHQAVLASVDSLFPRYPELENCLMQ